MSLVSIYELMRLGLSKLDSEFIKEDLPVEAGQIKDFQPMPLTEDQSVRGLSGLISFRINLQTEEIIEDEGD